MPGYFGFSEDDIAPGHNRMRPPDELLEQCRFLQLLSEQQCDHIAAALGDRNARVFTVRLNDGGLRWVITYDVEMS